MLAAKEKSLNFSAQPFPLPETRVWGSTVSGTACTGGSTWISSTTQWACGYSYDGIASESLDQRYYSATYGRFITADRYKASSKGSGDASNPQSWNRYAYVLNDPVNHGDPTGEIVNDCYFDGDCLIPIT